MAVLLPTEVEVGLTLSRQSRAAGHSEDVPLQTEWMRAGASWTAPAAVAPRRFPWKARVWARPAAGAAGANCLSVVWLRRAGTN